VQVLPWMGISFASTAVAGLLMFTGSMRGGAPSNTLMLSFPLLIAGLSALLSLAKDAAFLVWTRDRLFSRFRVEAARTLGAPRQSGNRSVGR
jgi:hypothetical protein